MEMGGQEQEKAVITHCGVGIWIELAFDNVQLRKLLLVVLILHLPLPEKWQNSS